MSYFPKQRGTTEYHFQIGLAEDDGVVLSHNTTDKVAEFKTVAGSAFINVRGLAPVVDDDFVTKKYFEDHNASADGLTYAKLAVGTSTVVSNATKPLPANAIIRDVVLRVTTQYSTGADISVAKTGGSPSLMGVDDNNPQKVNDYQTSPMADFGTSGTITVTVEGSPAAGAATLYIGYVVPTDIA